MPVKQHMKAHQLKLLVGRQEKRMQVNNQSSCISFFQFIRPNQDSVGKATNKMTTYV